MALVLALEAEVAAQLRHLLYQQVYVVTIPPVHTDDFFLFPSLSFDISPCTILRPQSMTPGIACDSKSPIDDRPGPLVRPRLGTIPR